MAREETCVAQADHNQSAVTHNAYATRMEACIEAEIFIVFRNPLDE
jgi:hypothetical protein